MNVCTWIVCERGGRWTPALRLALESGGASGVRHRIREVRHTAELDRELAERPEGIVALEVHCGNFSDVLAWLALAERRHPGAKFIALADRPLHVPEISGALREAGAVVILRTSRAWPSVIEMGRRITRSTAKTTQSDEEFGPQSLTALAWAAVPWQDT